MDRLRAQVHRLADRLFPWMVRVRRDLHAHPEISYREFRTQGRIQAALRGLGFRNQRKYFNTGLAAVLHGHRPGKTFAVRSDIDALPIEEMSGKPYRSRVPGVMHACGHDAHTAVNLGVAAILSALKDKFPGSVKFIFQPAEEVYPPGGAEEMVREGVMEAPRVDAITGFHTNPDLKAGKIMIRYGALTGTSDEFRIDVLGRGGHGAKPDQTRDPITAAAYIITAVQTVVSRNAHPLEPVVVSFGKVEGGTAHNQIPDSAVISGTVRTANPAVRREIGRLLQRVAHGTAAGLGVRLRVKLTPNCEATVNHPAVTRLIEQAGRTILGAKNVIEKQEIDLGTEDFNVYARKAPGSYFFFGVRGKGCAEPLHSPRFDVDERGMLAAVKVVAFAALTYLRGENP